MQKENAPARNEILASFLAHQARKEMPWSWRVGKNLPTFPDESVEIRSDGMMISASDKQGGWSVGESAEDISRLIIAERITLNIEHGKVL